jgi:enoyl-CoA hydratase/carnithine racemase
MLKTVNPTFKYYFCLHANETLNRLEQTPKLGDRGAQRPHRRRRARDRDGGRPRIARKGAARSGLPEVTLGVLPGTGGTQRLARLVNKSTAIELMTTGETFDFEKAQQLGIVNQIWETATNDEFIEKIQKYAEQFCPPNKASKAVGRIKRLGADGRRDPVRVRARRRARAAAAAVPERRREGRPVRVRREAEARLHRPVTLTRAQ